MHICPGSYWNRAGGGVYHEACIISNGNIRLMQRQLYLARWERGLGLSRGTSTGLCDIKGWKVGVVLSTDVFYPQVSRVLALMGADIVLSPVGFAGKPHEALKLCAMWRETQQNLFFAVESAFNGTLGGIDLWGESIIHAPLEMTEDEDGILARTAGICDTVSVTLDRKQRFEAIEKFNVLKQLNPEFYRSMAIFKGECSDARPD
jgi:predicted amidohydrolase